MSAPTFLFALVMTAVFAAVGFNTPSWSRSFTSAARYRAALAAHIVLYLLLFLVTFALVSHWPGSSSAIDASTRSELILVALAITLAFRAIPPLARALRNHLHELAGITSYAIRRATFLAESDIEASPAIRQRAKVMLLACGIDADRDWLPIAQPLHEQMMRTAQLFIQLCSWEDKPRFASFQREAANELFRMRQRFDGLAFRVARTLATIESLAEVRHLFSEQSTASGDLDKRLKPMVGNLISDACEDVALFHRDACLFAVRGVLSTESMRRGRERAFARLGFVKSEREVLSVYRVFPYAAALLFIGLWVFFLILPPIVPAAPGQPTLTDNQRIVIIVLIVMGALTIAIFPKLNYGFANCGLRQQTPWPFIVSAGVCAVLFAMLVNIEAGAVIYGGRAGAWQRLTEGLPYAPTTFVTSATVAWLIQDHRWRQMRTALLRRLCDAGVFGLMWTLVSPLTSYLRDDPTPRAITAAIGAFVFGAAMGALIPELVRSNRLRGADGTVMPPPRYLTPVSTPLPDLASLRDGPGPRAAA